MKPMKCACAAPASPMIAAADGEGLQPEFDRVLSQRQGGRLVLADRPEHAAPGAAQQPLQGQIEDDDHGGEHAEIEQR